MGWVDLWVVGTGGHIWRRRLTPTTALYQTFSFLFTSLRLKIKRYLECIRPNCPNWRPRMQIAIYDSALWSLCTTQDNWGGQSRVKIEQNWTYFMHLLGKLTFLSFGVVLSEWCSSQREMSGDGHFWHWQLVSLPGQMLLRGKGDWSKLNDPFIRDSVWCSQ